MIIKTDLDKFLLSICAKELGVGILQSLEVAVGLKVCAVRSYTWLLIILQNLHKLTSCNITFMFAAYVLGKGILSFKTRKLIRNCTVKLFSKYANF